MVTFLYFSLVGIKMVEVSLKSKKVKIVVARRIIFVILLSFLYKYFN